MSEEEKKSIEYLKRHIIPVYGKKGNIEYMLNDVLLNLIERQQRQIEDLIKYQAIPKLTLNDSRMGLVKRSIYE